MEERIEQIHDYFAGALSPEQHRELEAWLKEDSRHVDLFLHEAALHRGLIDAANARRSREDTSSETPLLGELLTDDDESPFGGTTGPAADSSTAFYGWNGLIPKLGFILVVVALGIVAAKWSAAPSHPVSVSDTAGDPAGEHSAPDTIRKPRDSAVASIESLGPCTWKHDRDGAPGPGTKSASRISSGRTIRLVEGKARVSFDCGAVLTLTGPSALRVDSAMDATLLAGDVSATVSQEAIGFLLHTSQMDVRDLGTKFEVCVDPEKGTKVEVLDGKVEADFARRGGDDKETVSLTRGQYLRAGNKASVAPESLRVFRGTRIDFETPNSLDFFTIERPDSNLYALDAAAGELHLDATSGSIFARSVRGDNLFLLPVSDSADLDVVLSVEHFEPSSEIEHIGLVYLADEDNYARIIYAAGHERTYLKFTVERNGVPFHEIEEPADFGEGPFKLRLTRRGGEVSSWWSVDDGKHWNFRDKGIAPPNARYVGFYVANCLPEGRSGGRARIDRLEVECGE